MSSWSLTKLLDSVHDDMKSTLERTRQNFSHPGTMGDASEHAWLSLFQKYLPKRYQAQKAHIVDSKGVFSEQIDIVIFDRQYSPFIFDFEGQKIIPAESVYAVFEAKQSVNSSVLKYAQQKIQSVRQLHRTSLPIPHAGGTFDPKAPHHIYGGILSLESDWSPALGSSLVENLEKSDVTNRIDIGCVAAHGYFYWKASDYCVINGGKAATEFLFKLISVLQFNGTVPMIDVLAYSNWLTKTA